MKLYISIIESVERGHDKVNAHQPGISLRSKRNSGQGRRSQHLPNGNEVHPPPFCRHTGLTFPIPCFAFVLAHPHSGALWPCTRTSRPALSAVVFNIFLNAGLFIIGDA